MTSLKTLLKSYLEEKEKYESEGYSFFWIFEVNYIHEIRELYAKKLVAFEDRLNRISDDLCPEEEKSPKKLGNFLMCGYKQKKFGTEALEGVKVIHLGTREGFSGGEIFVDTEMTDARKAHKHELFIKAFKKLISDRLLVPDQSVVLVTSEDHHMLRTTKRAMPENKPPSAKKLKLENQAQLKGQQKIPEFFKLTKSASTSLSAGKGKPKEPTSLEPREFKIEQITRLLRGDQVKILFLPKLHYELDASQYVSIFLLYEIKRLQEDEEIIDIKRQCVTAVDHLNSEVWKFAIDHVERCERFYRDNDYNDTCLSAENLEEEVEAENGVVVKEEDEPKEPIEVTTAAQSDRNADENNEISAPSAQGGDT